MSLVACHRGCWHFGRWGAAGVLLRSGDAVLLQLRANSHHADTWSTPGGSLDPGETPVQAALRELREELVGVPLDLDPVLAHVADHGGWAYHTYVRDLPEQIPLWPSNDESAAVEWVGVDEVRQLPLHPGFAAAWPELSMLDLVSGAA